MKVVAIVEGDGEVAALPILLRRIAAWRTPSDFPEVATPIRVKRDRFLNRSEEFERYLRLAAAKSGDDGWILILLDSEGGCPAEIGMEILPRARMAVAHRRVSLVLAHKEYEAWFMAAALSLNGQRGFACNERDLIDAETRRDAKGWVRDHTTTRVYGETTDQPAFTALMSLEQAFARSRSFRKLCSEWDRQALGTDDPVHKS
jgi:hypothetical protein